MIDLLSERVISFTDATAVLPRRRAGRKPHVATLYRWAQKGCRGVRLETIQIGGTKCTSVEALQRFFERLSGSSGAVLGAQATVATMRTRGNVLRELESEGL